MKVFGSEPLPKAYVHGTHRLCEPAVTWERIRPAFGAVGLTRIADITQLDYIGIPTAMSVRPNSRCLSVSQGKGLTWEQAKVSAAMESIESWHAEHVRLPRTRASHARLRRIGPALDPARLNLHRLSVFHDELPIDWVSGVDLLSEEPVYVPYDLVHTDFVVGAIREPPCFLTSSNGLASGNHLAEATIHALCELVERDASSLWFCRATRGGAADTRIDPATVRDPTCRALLERLEAAAFDVSVWDETSDLGIPSVGCKIFEREPRSFAQPVRLAAGFGCHLSRETALIRAVTEAVQSRLTAIAGARDDLFRRFYASIDVAAGVVDIGSPVEGGGTRDFESLPSVATGTLDGDLALLLERLAAAGVGQVALVDLGQAAVGIPVARVVVPDLEHLGHEGSFRRYGRRAERVLAAP